MIGQKNLRETISSLCRDNKYPRFSILVGTSGSGKKCMSRWIADTMHIQYAQVGKGIEDVRNLIFTAYKVDLPMLYCIADADAMSPTARSALLKLTEEPPKNAYIMMTFSDMSNIMSTLKSRAAIFEMECYREYQIAEYYKSKYSGDDEQIIRDLCCVPGDVDMIAGKAEDFRNFVYKVIDNIGEVSTSNVFKIADGIKLKDTDTDKWDLMLFWRAFVELCIQKCFETQPINTRYLEWARVTSNYIGDLKIVGINKSALFSMWIIDVRGCPWN